MRITVTIAPASGADTGGSSERALAWSVAKRCCLAVHRIAVHQSSTAPAAPACRAAADAVLYYVKLTEQGPSSLAVFMRSSIDVSVSRSGKQ